MPTKIDSSLVTDVPTSGDYATIHMGALVTDKAVLDMIDKYIADNGLGINDEAIKDTYSAPASAQHFTSFRGSKFIMAAFTSDQTSEQELKDKLTNFPPIKITLTRRRMENSSNVSGWSNKCI